MRRFYIIYKDAESIEGKVNCTEEEFIKRFIEPNKANIHNWYLWPKQEILTDETVELFV